MFRIKGDPKITTKLKCYTTASTGGNVSSSDIGSIMVFSSNEVSLSYPCTDLFSLTTAGTVLPVAGILDGLTPDSSGAIAVASTRYKCIIQPIQPGELLEADYTTDTTFWTQANEYLDSTSLNKYLRVCGGGSSSSVGTTSGTIVTDSTDTIVFTQAQYIDVSTAATIVGSSFPFMMVDYSTRQKTVDILFMANSTVDTLTIY